MRALWLQDQTLRLREDLPPLTPPPGEALVRVSLAGICNTDLELARGYYPFTGVIGHEFVGRVLVHARYPLSRAMEAMETARQPKILKVLLEC